MQPECNRELQRQPCNNTLYHKVHYKNTLVWQIYLVFSIANTVVCSA